MMSSYPVTPLPIIGFHSTSIVRPQSKLFFFTILGRGGTSELTENKPLLKEFNICSSEFKQFYENERINIGRQYVRAVRRMSGCIDLCHASAILS